MGTWVINIWLIWMYLFNRPVYDAEIAAGATVVNCIDWDASGRVIPGVCIDPPPATIIPAEK